MTKIFGRAAARCLVAAMMVAFGVLPRTAPGQANISPPAYELINNRAAADRGSFYVYLDQDSGPNHGFASGFMGTDQGTSSGPRPRHGREHFLRRAAAWQLSGYRHRGAHGMARPAVRQRIQPCWRHQRQLRRPVA
jgi:hypothetical protein